MSYENIVLKCICMKVCMCRDMVESGADLFEGVISEMFQLADQGQKGYVSKEEFTNVCLLVMNVHNLCDVC